ncbi:uncharacterized protein RCO7_09413 [Rhynchosporium graminicola]|uniref:Uncharacterized protein n=1 Tax=Rhynchosporium graminicola TaxID=2792576 RepID=A0A1E1KWK7_9HELO|nr:uncharacterized protein RCO7_09413 [Rhynchosporium commune]
MGGRAAAFDSSPSRPISNPSLPFLTPKGFNKSKSISSTTVVMIPISTVRRGGGVAARVANQIRFNTTEAGQKAVSPHVGFYKTFTRPVAKVLLMATFTYQLAYWGWVYLEKGEIRKQKSAEIEGLENKLAVLTQEKVKEP